MIIAHSFFQPTLQLRQGGEGVGLVGAGLGVRLQHETAVREQRRQVFERDFAARAVGVAAVDRVHLQQGKEAFLVLGRADFAFDQVAKLNLPTKNLIVRSTIDVGLQRKAEEVGLGI